MIKLTYQIAPVNTDFNGVELVLDADADTTIHAETDDIIDIRVADNDIIKIQQSSGDGILKVATDAKDLIFQQADGNKLFEINDGNFVGVGGNATAPMEIRIFEDSDNNQTTQVSKRLQVQLQVLHINYLLLINSSTHI